MDLAHHGLVLLKRLNAQREFGFLCDCTVTIGDVLFKAHKAVLAAFSNYFRMLFIHQDGDCVRLKPSDVQPDIFSYLLNLMYTGKFTSQPIDPVRLEQGVKFLHAYPLLQEASLINPESQYVPLTNSLYGIQISDPTCSAQNKNTACRDGKCEILSQGCSDISDMEYRSPQPVGIESPTQNTAAAVVQHLTYGIMRRTTSSRKHYRCNHCGIRFSQRCKLREHLLVHTNQPRESQTSSIQNDCGVEADSQEMEEEHLHADSDFISDTDQHTWMEDTPPPSDIADIDTMEGTDMEREMKRRKFECPTCARKFIQRSHWREHMYIHTGKPYKCSTCGKNFCRANQASRHVCLSQGTDSYIIVNKQSLVLCGGEDNSQVEALFLASERRYKCSICAVPFASPSEVPKHQCLVKDETAPLVDNPLGVNEALETIQVTAPSQDIMPKQH
ncbi:zinc finger and BTB domain-containing protein 2a [Triplophysa rosa]|uniref:Zinc finger and BTB domain containing 2a n=1 Tax=Triplophysa rosa TaxID=992332 RepID=A0A9W7WMJ4_TRIRA|nr:zinc finger and BTB domain-containing protein 2a [Triplophysa rosa]KAI7804939.1 putative zinc finger and BTB domain containing 2a [Triplophysa rosa]